MPSDTRHHSLPSHATCHSPPPYELSSPLRLHYSPLSRSLDSRSPDTAGYLNLMQPGAYGTAHVHRSLPAVIAVPTLFNSKTATLGGLLPRKNKLIELRKIQHVSLNLTTFHVPKSIEQVAW